MLYIAQKHSLARPLIQGHIHIMNNGRLASM